MVHYEMCAMWCVHLLYTAFTELVTHTRPEVQLTRHITEIIRRRGVSPCLTHLAQAFPKTFRKWLDEMTLPSLFKQ